MIQTFAEFTICVAVCSLSAWLIAKACGLYLAVVREYRADWIALRNRAELAEYERDEARRMLERRPIGKLIPIRGMGKGAA